MIKSTFLTIVLLASTAISPILPNSSLTPGAWHVPATPLNVLCRPGYTSGKNATGRRVRNVSATLKKKIYQEYLIDPRTISRG